MGNVKSSCSQKPVLPGGLGRLPLIGEKVSGGAEAFFFLLSLPLPLLPFFADFLLPVGEELRLF